jgi:hypothetical protein
MNNTALVRWHALEQKNQQSKGKRHSTIKPTNQKSKRQGYPAFSENFFRKGFIVPVLSAQELEQVLTDHPVAPFVAVHLALIEQGQVHREVD